MPARYFTVEEANSLLPTIKPLMGRLLEKRARVVQMSQGIESLLSDIRVDVGGPVPSDLVNEFAGIELLIDKIQSYGCIVKDLNAGLLDFLAERNGHEVYLCWRYGEPKIEYYHDLHKGFGGRRRV